MAFPKEIEYLIFRGFLTVKTEIAGTKIVLKSVNENEHDLINTLSTNNREKINYLLAFSVYLFEKVNVLVSPRIEKIENLFKFFNKLKGSITAPLYKAITGLNRKSIKALRDVRRFTYDDLSRMRWPSAKVIGINSSQFTGVEGTENLGINLHQQMWYTLNQYEDIKEYSEIGWSLIKPLMRLQMKKQDFSRLESSDKQRKKEELEERERILKGVDAVPPSKDSKESLYEEVQRSIVRGEKDEHDLFISDYERQIKERALHKEVELEQIRKDFRQKFNLERDQGAVIGETRIASEEDLAKLSKPVKSQKEMPTVSEKLASQMADLSPEEIEKIKKEHLSQFKNSEDDFFVGMSSSAITDEELNNQLLKAKPGTKEYKELVEKIRKQSVMKLE